MVNSDLSIPSRDEFEVSIFGPGYGESIVIHMGDGKWMIVDSCLDPGSELPAALAYLLQIDVEVDKAVKLVVATHWHDDHIRGISGVFNACQSAEFVISDALNREEFLKLVATYQERSVAKSSGLDEFSKVFELLKERKRKGIRFYPPRFAAADKLLFRDNFRIENHNVPVNIYSLSPSDATTLQSMLAFEEALPKKEENPKRVNSPTSNLSSIVLWVEVGQHKILLGADLEETSNPKTGWSVIVDESNVASGVAGVFKVPHHGSENAHHDDVWSRLLIKEPFAILSPFCRGKKLLPSEADVDRITGLTPNTFLTAPARRKTERWRRGIVRDFINDITKTMVNVNNGWGHIRLRRSIINPSVSWEVTLMGDAHQVISQNAPKVG